MGVTAEQLLDGFLSTLALFFEPTGPGLTTGERLLMTRPPFSPMERRVRAAVVGAELANWLASGGDYLASTGQARAVLSPVAVVQPTLPRE